MASRTQEDLAALQKAVLAWDYYALIKGRSEPPHRAGMRNVPDVFDDEREYIDTFVPLLLEEALAQAQQGGEDTDKVPHRCVVAEATPLGDFVEVTVGLEDGALSSFAQNDLVLLTKDDPGDAGPDNLALHALAQVEGVIGAQRARLRFYLPSAPPPAPAAKAGKKKAQGSPARLRVMAQSLQVVGTAWFVMGLCNLSTIMREWTATHSVVEVPFKDVLLRGKPGPGSSLTRRPRMEIPRAMEEAMRPQYNTPQMEAVRSGLDGSPLVLIQGPPGTGKTSTILGLLSLVLHSSPAGDKVNGQGGPTGQRGANGDARTRLWRRASPWLNGGFKDLRDELPSPDELQRCGNDTYGMVQPVTRRVLAPGGPRARVLVCAPSNSALDEIVLRIMSKGLLGADGELYHPSIVRVGVNVHHAAVPVHVDTLVAHRIGATNERAQAGQRHSLGLSRAEKDRIRMQVLEEASIVCSTLSFSGSGIFERIARRFDVVIIDEAAQAVEPSTMVPLSVGARQVYLVGDPNQLPATVISQQALARGYHQSLFRRLQSVGYPVRLLTTQYRMHPKIRAFPSKQFYGGSLVDADGIEAATRRPWHDPPSGGAAACCFGPLAFFDVQGEEVVPGAGSGSSVSNPAEVALIIALYRAVVQLHPELADSGRVGVISPYKAQVRAVRSKLAEALGEEAAAKVDVNTIDGFQGREKDIVLFSTVRSQPGRHIGFVSDERRINVGLTRARSSLLVVGNARALLVDSNWRGLVEHAVSEGCLFRLPDQGAAALPRVLSGDLQPVVAGSKAAAELLEEVTVQGGKGRGKGKGHKKRGAEDASEEGKGAAAEDMDVDGEAPRPAEAEKKPAARKKRKA
ncbi:unnamed protein product [Pedinophyceae sp. YPF-701]|nr:unnamed protein product [Pedinophyceae sp. YPF-701]